ncbi:MAG: AAA family ATPase [Thermoguttaceae bacterium]
MKPKLLPIGRQDFKTIIEDNCVYVDKTEHIYRLITSDKYYFLSRPRRFGKSLLVTTMKYLFLGEKELFKGLYVYDSDWKFDKYPVIDLYFNNIPYREIGLRQSINERLQKIAKNYDVDVFHEENGCFFDLLINTLHEKYNRKVVILIDEYDKPITDNLLDMPLARTNRDILRDFYGAIKSNDHAIQFFFMTGVTKFSQVSIFSQLNNLKDLTTRNEYATICGFTEDELKTDFGYYVDRAQETFNGTLWEKLRDKYNGFSWNGKDFVYNPFSYLLFLDSREMDNYWFESGGSPKFLIDLIRNNNYDLGKVTAPREVFRPSLLAFDFETIDLDTLLFQTGYATIKGQAGEDLVVVDFPNNEVRQSFVTYLLADYSTKSNGSILPIARHMQSHLQSGDFAKFVEAVDSILAEIPYNLHSENESNYHSSFFLLCRLLGVGIDCEVLTSKGRIDAVIKTDKRIYIIEFKVNVTPATAIKQIVKNKYADRYKTDNRTVVLAGICFDTKKKETSHKCVTQQEREA